MKISPEGPNDRFELAEKWIAKLKIVNKDYLISETERWEGTASDTWNNIKHANICIIRVRGEKRKRKGKGRNYIWWNHDWIFPKPEEGNKYAGTGNTECPKQDEPKQTHRKTYHN